jgi:hypothetical protein
MMGCRQVERAASFYEFPLERNVPADRLLPSIDRFVEFGELKPELITTHQRSYRSFTGYFEAKNEAPLNRGANSSNTGPNGKIKEWC